MKIFISYCGDDAIHKNHLKERLIPLVNEYKELEIIEMSTHCAGNWDEWMIPAVKSCDIFVPLITDNAMYPKSGVPKRMLEELTAARNTNKKMVPVIMSQRGVSDTFQAHIGRISQVWYAYDVDGDGDPFDEAVEKVRILINAILKNDSIDQGESVDVIGCGVVQNTRFVGRTDYLEKLESAYILHRCSRYDLQGKELLKTQEKFYLADSSFKYSVLGYNDRSIAAMLENVVYLELLRRGYEVCIGKTPNGEIDFIATKQNDKLYIQITREIQSEKTEKREYDRLLEIADNYPKYLLRTDAFAGGNYKGIKTMHVADFLLSKEY
jgi:hypothetical protein